MNTTRPICLPLLFGCLVLVSASLIAKHAAAASERLALQRVTLNHPVPALPYYHFRAELDLPRASMLDVEASIDGERLRYVALKETGQPRSLDRPLIHHRPPFADVYSVNTRKYRRPYIVGWLPWQPGKTYRLDVKVRLRREIEPTERDTLLWGTAELTAPADAVVFPSAWQDYKAVVLSETAGLARTGEPVDVLLSFYGDQATNLQNDIRVVAVDPKSKLITEVPSQVYDIRQDVLEGDPRERNYKGQRRQAKIWVPTTTARVAFLADVPARSSKVYLIYHNNADAEAPQYETDLKAAGPPPGISIEDDRVADKPGYRIENSQIEVVLHPLSGVIDELLLKSRPKQRLVHKLETNGAIHWCPEAYPPPRPWTHTSDWKEPKFDSWTGPIVATTLAQGGLPYIPEAQAHVSYKVYAGRPCIETTTSMRVDKALRVQASRNGELVFQRQLLTHLAWPDVISGRVETVDLRDLPDSNQLLMEDDVPWITAWNPETRIALGAVQLEYANAGVEELPRVHDPHFYAIVGPYLYWTRALNFTFSSSASQHLVEIPRGSQFWERWAFVLYEPAEGAKPYQPMLPWYRKLTAPLRVRVVEEVEPRVPRVGTEIYIDPNRTGWEGRDTRREE